MIEHAVTPSLTCPFCDSQRLKRDGYTLKGFKRFCCHVCQRYWQDAYVRAKPNKIDPQKELFAWARLHPIVSMYLVAVPNGGCRRPKEVEKRIAQGLALNVGDVLLAYPHHQYHGLWIEFYKEDQKLHSCLSKAREKWILSMQNVGYQVKSAQKWQEAAQEIEKYLT